MVFLPNTNIMAVISCIKFENIKQIITTFYNCKFHNLSRGHSILFKTNHSPET